jgi:hypothetical protein
MTDWGLGAQIAATGILTVFGVLGVLSLVLWLSSNLIRKILYKKPQKSAEKQD